MKIKKTAVVYKVGPQMHILVLNGNFNSHVIKNNSTLVQ